MTDEKIQIAIAVEMPWKLKICRNCEWWKKRETAGDCEHPEEGSFSLSSMIIDYAGPEFGCVHFEARDE